MKKNLSTIFILTMTLSAITGWLVSSIFSFRSDREVIRDYYRTITLAEVSPHLLIQRIKSWEEITIVDVRDPASFALSHIPWAINIPADDPELIQKFQDLNHANAIVTYCYTQDCMASRQVGNTLAENGMYVQHLNVWYAEREAKEWTWNAFDTSGACPLTWAAGC